MNLLLLNLLLLTTIEDNEPNTFTSTPSSHSEIFSSDNSVLSKQVDRESTIKTSPITDVTTVSSLSVHSTEASTATLGENSFSNVASTPLNIATSLRSTSSSSNHATESSGTVKVKQVQKQFLLHLLQLTTD